MELYSDTEIEQELQIQRDEGVDDLAARGKLGLSVIAQILKKSKYCRLCEKDFDEIVSPDGGERLEQLLVHISTHLEDDFRARPDEIESYFK